MSKQVRYIEISTRNTRSRILVNACPSDEVCVDIVRSGSECCQKTYSEECCGTQPRAHSSCGCGCKSGCVNSCDKHRVCATEIDDNGYAVFDWPSQLLNLKQGWYNAYVTVNCSDCVVLPLRIGKRCNVSVVETEVIGPDCPCDNGCEQCGDDKCLGSCNETFGETGSVYVPDYEV